MIKILTREVYFEIPNCLWCHKKKLYQTVITNKSITVIPTTETDLWKVQIVIVFMDLGNEVYNVQLWINTVGQLLKRSLGSV